MTAPSPRAAAAAPVGLQTLDLSDADHRRWFLEVQDRLRAADPGYCAGLWRDRMYGLDASRNAALADLDLHALVAVRGASPVGRILVYRDRHHDAERGAGTGWFGAFAAADDPEGVDALVAGASAWLAARGCRRAFGPWPADGARSPGARASDFDAAAKVGAPDDPPHHLHRLLGAGLTLARARTALRWSLDDLGASPASARLLAQAADARQRGELRVRPVELRTLERELPALFAVAHRGQADDWGRAPVRREAFDAVTYERTRHALPELTLAVEWRGEVVGSALALPDVHRILPRSGRLSPLARLRLGAACRSLSHARLVDLTVAPEARALGAEAVLLAELAERARALGFRELETFGLDDGRAPLKRALEQAGARAARTEPILRLDTGLGPQGPRPSPIP